MILPGMDCVPAGLTISISLLGHAAGEVIE